MYRCDQSVQVIEFHAFFQIVPARHGRCIRTDLTIIPTRNRIPVVRSTHDTMRRNRNHHAQNYTGMQDASLTNSNRLLLSASGQHRTALMTQPAALQQCAPIRTPSPVPALRPTTANGPSGHHLLNAALGSTKKTLDEWMERKTVCGAVSIVG
jgi:hypothetical protein